MPEEKSSYLPLGERLNLLQREFVSYIQKNAKKVEANLPVFYGYVIASLDDLGGEIDDASYDAFIDAISGKLLEGCGRAADPEFIEKVIANALRCRKHAAVRTGLDIAAGVQLMKAGDYAHAIPYLSRYAEADAAIGTALAYCYYMLSLSEIAGSGGRTGARPGESELLAREQMLLLVERAPPVHRLPELLAVSDPLVTRAFWLMISCALEWFPSEKRFFYMGLEKARRDGNREMRLELLKIATERFFDDMVFLRESFYIRLEERDAIGAAGVVKQMMQQYPEDLEPIYYGMKLSLLTTVRSTYETFRKLAIAKGMPPYLVQLQDLAFALLTRENQNALRLIRDLKRKPPSLPYYATALEYIAHDFFHEDEKRAKRAKKALLDSIDQFCLQTLRVEPRIALQD
ncbi:MAG: hypothetical protein QMD46_08015 [Methanomicrobiales archaeon]|nr:hypothetical protein [Methanomicrobiales archaeon]MDI6877321.1 hypothetical protein [Methanomicrobiales archaeon]